MRELKFRGKDTQGDWVHGTLVQANGNTAIAQEDMIYTVDPETLCQYTGVKDMYGTEIYEHDLIKIGDKLYEPLYDERETAFLMYSVEEDDIYPVTVGSWIRCRNKQVVGNTFDYPELLKKGEDD